MHEIGPFSIPAMRDFVPEKLRPWIVIFIVIVFQFSGGVYLAAVNEMVGSTALMQEDILMAGYASMVGMGLTFAIMFRLKFRFPSKVALLTCGTVIIIANLICMHTTSVPILVVTCFVAGFFRMWATFECNSTIQLWLTPKRDLSVFFSYIYLLVQSCIQLSGLITIYTAFWSKWEYMHLLIIGLLLATMILITIVFRNFRTMPKIPLYGIDWLGAFMWGVILMCVIFVCVYGEHYDWYNSEYIWMATIGGGLTLILNRWRASFIRHPYIANQTWKYKAVYLTFFLYIVVDILLSPSHLLEHIYLEAVLGYDMLHLISINWIVLFGVVIGAIFTYLTFARQKWAYRTMTLIAFVAITAYLMIFYFTIDYNLPKETLYLPVFLRSFGYVIIAICFLTYLSHVPFHHFFMAVSVQSFVSAGFGSVLGTAVLGRTLNIVMKKNAMLLGSQLDQVNPATDYISLGQLYGAVQQQALMVSMKELFGWLSIMGLGCLFILMLKAGTERPFKALHPTYRYIRRAIKHELRERQLWKI
ncbi:MAG: hypothetical protein Q4A54_05470 [Parabacteroides sp.]|nr:hypothetical protein [Parabacteroides sp.]